jgi:hypothetical protein
LTIDSVITGESLLEPPDLQCGGSSSDGPVNRPERDGSGTGGTFRVLRVRTITGGPPPGGRLGQVPSDAHGPIASQAIRGRGPGFRAPLCCGRGRLLPQSVPRGSRAVSTPGVSSLMAHGPSVPRVSSPMAHRPLVPIGQIPVAHRPSVPRPVPPARGPSASESHPAEYWPSVAQSAAAGAGPVRTPWHAV